MSLTDLLIKKLKPPVKGQKTYFDGVQKGFGIRVSKGGTKTFVLVTGKERTIHTLGRYPDMPLMEARKRAKTVLGEVVAEKKGVRPSLSFPEARERFLADTETRTRPSTHAEYRRLLTKHFTWAKQLHTITRGEVMEAVTAVRDRPSLEQHCFVAIRTFFNWAHRHGYITQSPVPSLRFSSTSRSRVLTDEELKLVWKRAEEVGYPYGTVIKLLILTGQRRGEIAALRRSWIKDGWIHLPGAVCKNGREHDVPIGPLTKGILDAIPGNTTDLLFPARGKQETPMSNWAHLKAQFDKPMSLQPWTLHDLRRTFASKLAALGTPIHVTERLLNHVSGAISGVAAVYNRHSYSDAMRAASMLLDEHFQFVSLKASLTTESSLAQL